MWASMEGYFELKMVALAKLVVLNAEKELRDEK